MGCEVILSVAAKIIIFRFHLSAFELSHLEISFNFALIKDVRLIELMLNFHQLITVCLPVV
jgi:hypothetical protein